MNVFRMPESSTIHCNNKLDQRFYSEEVCRRRIIIEKKLFIYQLNKGFEFDRTAIVPLKSTFFELFFCLLSLSISVISNMLWMDQDSSDDSESNDHTVTEKDPNFGKKESCNCGAGCKTRSCNCVKFGSTCNSSCSCGSSCNNMFNTLLPYIFGDNLGEDKKCDANPCFAKWLIKKGRNSNGSISIDRDNLRNLIMSSGR